MNIEITVTAQQQGLTDVTAPVRQAVATSGIQEGVVHVFIRHTSASLTIQENADPRVLDDMANFLNQLVPEDPILYTHNDEGPDDMPAHIKAAITTASLPIPVSDGRLALGTWQGIFLWEHRHRAHNRKVVVHTVGE